VHGRADILSSGRDPDQPAGGRVPWRLVAVTVALVGAAVAVGLQFTGRPGPPVRPAADTRAGSMPVLLRGAPLRPDLSLGTLLIGGPGELRLLTAVDRLAGSHGWVNASLRLPGRLGSSPAVRQIASVHGGVVALLGNGVARADPAVGEVYFIPVGSQGEAAPRVIGRANYLAVAVNQHDIWLERASAPDGRRPDRAWLVDESGRRLSPVLQLHRQVLVADTLRGLLTQGPAGQGVRLINPASGTSKSAGVPGGALVVAAGPEDVAWQSASCDSRCSLHITNLRNGADTVIRLPPHTFPDGVPAQAAFGPGGRLAVAMATANHEDRTTVMSVYVTGTSLHRLIRLPGGPIPPLAAWPGDPSVHLPDIVSVRWAGSGIWIVTTDGLESQVAYWTGAGRLGVLAPMPGAADTFAVAAGQPAAPSR
jgi:hypothetical protein